MKSKIESAAIDQIAKDVAATWHGRYANDPAFVENLSEMVQRHLHQIVAIRAEGLMPETLVDSMARKCVQKWTLQISGQVDAYEPRSEFKDSIRGSINGMLWDDRFAGECSYDFICYVHKKVVDGVPFQQIADDLRFTNAEQVERIYNIGAQRFATAKRALIDLGVPVDKPIFLSDLPGDSLASRNDAIFDNYIGGLSIREIAKSSDLSSARISQIIGKIARRKDRNLWLSHGIKGFRDAYKERQSV